MTAALRNVWDFVRLRRVCPQARIIIYLLMVAWVLEMLREMYA